jgi:hypothetical protein
LSIGSAAGSFLSGVVAVATQYHIMWIISGIAAIVSLYAGILTIKEKRLNIRILEAKIDEDESEKQSEERKAVRRILKNKGGK